MGAGKVILAITFFLLLTELASAVKINEIMYDPSGSDSNREWIEIYNDENSSVDISGWKLSESGTNHNLNLANGSLLIEKESYAVIADDAATFLSEYLDFNSTLIESSFSLNNDGEYIAIKNSSLTVIDEINYSAEWGGNGNNFSLEKNEPIGPNNASNWAESLASGGTPGKLNSLYGKCDWKISISIDNSIFVLENGKSEINWKINLKEKSNKGIADFEYWVEDFYGNIVKSKIQKTTNVSDDFGPYQKTFNQAGGHIIIANITNTSCVDYAPGNNFANRAVIVKGNEESSIIESSINIISVPETAKFDDSADLGFNVYRGDTSKYAVYVWVEDYSGRKISEQMTFHFKTGFTNYTLKAPIMLYDNCDKKYNAGEYFAVVDGLGITQKKNFYVSDNEDCPVVQQTDEEEDEDETNDEEKTKVNYDLLYLPLKVRVREPFKAKLKIMNDDAKDRSFQIWSYVYRGSKSYSGEREENAQYISLSKGSSAITELENIVLDAEPGNYKFKIRIKKDSQKTLQEITKDIVIEESNITFQNQTIALSNQNDEEDSSDEMESSKTGKILQSNIVPFKVYESTTVKARNLAVYFMLILFALLTAAVIWKKEN